MSYSEAQKAVLPLFVIPCGVVLFLLYRYGRKSLRGEQTFVARMDYLYSFVAASIMGEFLFQAFPNSSLPMIAHNITRIEPGEPPMNSSIPSIFMMVGLFVMLCIQKYSRVWNDSPNYSASNLTIVEIQNVIDPETFEILEVFQADGMDNEHIGEQRMTLEDEHAELRKRGQLVLITLIIGSILCTLEGLFLVYQHGNKWIILFIFWLDKLMETVVVGTSMLHAYYHAQSRRTRNWFLLGSLVWCTVMILSTFPALLDLSREQATLIITHLATSIFYALAGGILFYVGIYYLHIDMRRTDLKETVARSVIFATTAATSWVVGYFY